MQKKSTEQIAGITSQLTEETDLAASLVEKSVTANTQQATELSNNHVVQMREAEKRISKVKDTIMQLKKYQDTLQA